MINDIVVLFGGQSGLARRLGVTDAAVSQWVADGVFPYRRAVEIERMTGGQFKAVDISRRDGDASISRS